MDLGLAAHFQDVLQVTDRHLHSAWSRLYTGVGEQAVLQQSRGQRS